MTTRSETENLNIWMTGFGVLAGLYIYIVLIDALTRVGFSLGEAIAYPILGVSLLLLVPFVLGKVIHEKVMK